MIAPTTQVVKVALKCQGSQNATGYHLIYGVQKTQRQSEKMVKQTRLPLYIDERLITSEDHARSILTAALSNIKTSGQQK